MKKYIKLSCNSNNITFKDGTTLQEFAENINKNNKSISSIITDDNNNVIVTFSDGATQNIGQLNIDVQADFLTSDGFGKLRYYNGKFQYFNLATETWVDTAATPDNVLVVNMMPNPMWHIIGIYDYELGHNKLKWTEPEDTVVEGQVICVVEKVIIRRKLGSVPENENDGDLVKIVERRDFGNYSNYWYVDLGCNPDIGDVYYYKAFPVSTTGFYNASTTNKTGAIIAKDHYLFGFILDQNESDPDSMITYIEDNKNFSRSYMDYGKNKFNYGDWQDFWFIKNCKPCMLNYDGTVDYYLDPNDVTKKLDGTDSDVANEDFEGNAMVEIPKVYWKVVDNGDDTANIYISDKKLDEYFVCWSHIDNSGDEIDYCYMPMYNGSLDSQGRLRSLSGKSLIQNRTAQQEVECALANNLTSDVIWYTEVFSDRQLINLLLLLIGKSTNTQEVFGNGHYTGSYLINTGTMDNKGLFFGSNGSGVGVKVFGIENYWGNQWRRVAGWVDDYGIQKIKMTYGQYDGSTVDGYNFDGSGYIEIFDSTPSGSNGGFVSEMKFTENGLIPLIVSGSATTKYCDGLYFDNGQVCYAIVGGTSSFSRLVGALYCGLDDLPSRVSWGHGASISCKPLANGGN